jgi:hypothetical protein
MELIGAVIRAQVQRGPLKPGERPFRWYDPAPLCAVPALSVSQDGVIGLPADGAPIVDVHNRTHPQTRHSAGNGLSVGFTSHYALMAARFGDVVGHGVAGENLLVETGRTFRARDLPGRLLVETRTGPVALEVTRSAEPCVEFTRFLLGYPAPPRRDVTLPDPAVTDALVFLRHGMRGYYLRLAGGDGPADGEVVLRAGDRLYAR